MCIRDRFYTGSGSNYHHYSDPKADELVDLVATEKDQEKRLAYAQELQDVYKRQDRYLEEIAAQVRIPVLRKDFTVDGYMIDQARVLGASAVLLICAILEDRELEEYLARAESLGLSALVEAHDELEVGRALKAGARILGVNNRDLRTFQVDVDNSCLLYTSIWGMGYKFEVDE